MRELTREVWDGNDYVPYVWDEWLADTNGALLVAESADGVVGLQHIAVREDGSAWLEGIRVAPHLQGKGVGKALMSAATTWCDVMRAPWAGLATSSNNPASNRLAASGGFVMADTFSAVAAEPVPGTVPPDVRVAAPAEYERVWQLLAGTRGDGPVGPVYTEGWTVYRLTPERVRLLLAMQCVLLHTLSDVDAACVVTTSPRRPLLRVGSLVGDIRGRVTLLHAVRASAHRLGTSRIRATVAGSDNVPKLRAAGFSSDDGMNMNFWVRVADSP